MQILRAHADVLLSSDQRLTKGQRYHFIAGWLPWLMDGLNLIFNVFALAWSAAMIVAPHRFDPPLMMFSVLPLALFAFKLAKLAHLYSSRVGANIRQTLAAALAGLALSHVVSVAVVKGLLTRRQPFYRTPKDKQPHALIEGFAAARAETAWLIDPGARGRGTDGSIHDCPGPGRGDSRRVEGAGRVIVGRGAADSGNSSRRLLAYVTGQRPVVAGPLAGPAADEHSRAGNARRFVPRIPLTSS